MSAILHLFSTLLDHPRRIFGGVNTTLNGIRIHSAVLLPQYTFQTDRQTDRPTNRQMVQARKPYQECLRSIDKTATH